MSIEQFAGAEHRGFIVSRTPLGRWLERHGGLTIRVGWENDAAKVTLLWDRPLLGWLWHWRHGPMVFEVQVKREGEDWTLESYPVDTRPVRR